MSSGVASKTIERLSGGRSAEAVLESAAPPSPVSAAVLGQGSSVYVRSFRLAVWIFAAFQCLYMLTSTGRVRTADEYNPLYTTESMVLRGSTAIPQAVQLHNFYGRLDLRGQPRAAYPPGQAVLCAPWYAFGYYVLARLPGVPRNDREFIVWFSTCASNATFSALTVAFFFLLVTYLGIGWRTSLFATALLGLATPIFGYAAWFFSEPLSAAIFMGVALLLFGPRDQISLRGAALAGLLLGFAVWVRPRNVLAIPVFAVAVTVRQSKTGWRAAAALCGCAALLTAALLSRNAFLFGNAFDFGYPQLTDYGIHTPVEFDTPLWIGLYGFLLSPGKSVFLFAPPLLLAIAGLRHLWKLDRGLSTLAFIFPGANLLFFSAYSSWEGGYCAGPRYLVPSIALACLGLAPALAEAKPVVKRLGVLLLALGAAVQCITLATSFLEDQAPLRGRYFDAHWKYRLSYSLSGQIQLFWKYLTQGQPHRLGVGWDRWFVFLHIAGVSGMTLAVIALTMIAGLTVSLICIIRTLRAADTVGGSTVPARS